MHRGGEETRGEERTRREGLQSSDIVMKESPALCWARLLSYSHPVWLPDTLAFTHTPVCTVEGETDPRDEDWETQTKTERERERQIEWEGEGERQLGSSTSECDTERRERLKKGVQTVVSGRWSMAPASAQKMIVAFSLFYDSVTQQT